MLLLLLACADDDSFKPVGPAETDSDGASLAVNTAGQLDWTSADGTRRRVTLGLGFVDTPDDGANYDPWNLYDPDLAFAIPVGIHLAVPVAAAATDAGWRLSFDNGAAAALTADNSGPGWRLSLTPLEGEPVYAFVDVGLEPGDRLYGLGELFDGVEHRGHVHPLQIELDVELESSYNEAHVPVPLLTSTESWGLLIEDHHPMVFDLGAVEADRMRAVVATRDGLNIDLYAPPTPTGVVERYHQRMGPPEVPPTWAFGPLQWRNVVTTSEVVRADADAMREHGIPTSLIWVDNPWQTTYNSMIPDPVQFPDWGALVADLHDEGFVVMAWTTPYLSPLDPEFTAYEAAGWLVDAPILFADDDFGELVDLTHPEAKAAWSARAVAARERGIEGWKLDYGEDAQLGVGARRLVYEFANGEDERTMHHQFAASFHSPYGEALDGEGFLLGRAGGLGTSSITDCIWPGDLDSDFRHFGEDGHVGGLPAAIRGGLGLSASGFPFFASDTGGYRHDRPTHEVMVRWTEYAAFLPIFQFGGGGANHNPWDFEVYGESAFTEATLESFVILATLHHRLFPFFYALATEAGTAGTPVTRARGLVFPEQGLDDVSFLVGDDLFVVPVESAGVTEVSLELPPGRWFHWWTEALLEGTAAVPAPIGQGPLFQRQGSALPMLDPTIETLAPAGPARRSWTTTPGPLHLRWIPGGTGVFELATGERWVSADQEMSLTPGSLYEGFVVEVWAPDLVGLTLDGVEVAEGSAGSGWSRVGGWVIVHVAGGGVLNIW